MIFFLYKQNTNLGSDDVDMENNAPGTIRPTIARRPAILRKKKPKLTDLTVDDSDDSEEYKNTSAEEYEEDPGKNKNSK